MSEGRVEAFFGFIKDKKSIWLAFVALSLGVFLMLFSGGNSKDSIDPYSAVDTAELESRVRDLCERVSGVGSAAVMITMDTAGEQVYAKNTRVVGKGEGSENIYEYVTASGGLVPTEEKLARVRGIAVVCSGGNDAAVRLTLTEMLCALFDIPASSVSIAYGK